MKQSTFSCLDGAREIRRDMALARVRRFNREPGAVARAIIWRVLESARYAGPSALAPFLARAMNKAPAWLVLGETGLFPREPEDWTETTEVMLLPISDQCRFRYAAYPHESDGSYWIRAEDKAGGYPGFIDRPSRVTDLIVVSQLGHFADCTMDDLVSGCPMNRLLDDPDSRVCRVKDHILEALEDRIPYALPAYRPPRFNEHEYRQPWRWQLAEPVLRKGTRAEAVFDLGIPDSPDRGSTHYLARGHAAEHIARRLGWEPGQSVSPEGYLQGARPVPNPYDSNIHMSGMYPCPLD